MDNKKKFFKENKDKGEVSLALVGLIMKKIYKIGFKIVYEKLLKDGDDGAGQFFKIDKAKFEIQNYDALLDDEKIDTPPSHTSLNIDLGEVNENQKKNLTGQEYGKLAAEILKKKVESDKEHQEIFEPISKYFFGNL